MWVHVCVCVCACVHVYGFKHVRNDFPSAFLALIIKACVLAIYWQNAFSEEKIVFSWFFAQSNFGEICDCV